MAYSSKHRYESRRERFNRTYRIIKLTLLFAFISAAILLYKNRQHVYTWWIIQFG